MADPSTAASPDHQGGPAVVPTPGADAASGGSAPADFQAATVAATEVPVPASETNTTAVDASSPPANDGASASEPPADGESNPGAEGGGSEEKTAGSLISDAKAEPEEKPEGAPEGKEENPDVSEETKPADAKTEEVPAEPAPLPAYEKWALPEGVVLTDERVGEFNTLLGTVEQRIAANPAEIHAVMQQFGQELVSFYIADAQARMAELIQYQKDSFQRMRDQWVSDFRKDREIGGNRQDTTLQTVARFLDRFGQQEGEKHAASVREAFAMTGAGDSPAVIRFMNWAATLGVERARPVAPQMPAKAVQVGSKAERLYPSLNRRS